MNRRNFVGGAATGLSALVVPASGWAAARPPGAALTRPANDRAYWLAPLLRVVRPVAYLVEFAQRLASPLVVTWK